jgi:hypothetical protein
MEMSSVFGFLHLYLEFSPVNRQNSIKINHKSALIIKKTKTNIVPDFYQNKVLLYLSVKKKTIAELNNQYYSAISLKNFHLEAIWPPPPYAC